MTALKIGKQRGQRGMLDMKWENSNSLLTCGYDGYIHKWDMRDYRTPVFSLEDPFNEALYCMETDDNWTVLSGAQLFGRVGLWDIRKLAYMQVM